MSEKCPCEHLKHILESETSLEVLGFSNGSKFLSVQEVKDAFRRMVLLIHPDKNDSPHASECFVRLKLAYDEVIGSIESSSKNIPRKRGHRDPSSNGEDNLRTFEDLFCDEDILRHAENWKRFRSGDVRDASVNEVSPDACADGLLDSAAGVAHGPEEKDLEDEFVCLLCRRRFTCGAHLDKHVALSALHKLNVNKACDKLGTLQ